MSNATRTILTRLLLLAAVVFASMLAMSHAESNSDSIPKDRNYRLWSPIELKRVEIYYRNYLHPGRDPLIYPHAQREGLNLGVDMDVLRYFYWDNRIISQTDPGQYRSIALNAKIGVRLTPYLFVQYEHLSQHLLDTQHSYLPKFPVEDSIGIVLRVYEAPTPRRAIIGESR